MMSPLHISWMLLACDAPDAPGLPTLSLDVTPLDAVVELDGHPLSTTPQSRTLPRVVSTGTHTITVSRPGFVSQTLPLRLTADQHHQAHIALQPLDIPLTVETHPPGATLSIRGTAVGVTPWHGQLPAGPLDVVIAGTGLNTEHHTQYLDAPLSLDVWLDPEGQVLDLLRIFPTGILPKGLAITQDQSQVWVASLGGAGVYVHDLQTGALLKEIVLPRAGSVEILLDESRRRAFATQMETARVFELNMDTLEIERVFRTRSNFTKVPALSADRQRLYASNWKGHNVTELDLDTGAVLRQLPAVFTPRGLYATPDGHALYVTSFNSGGLGRIDLAQGTLEVVAPGRALRHIVPSPDHQQLYVSDMGAAAIHVYEPATGLWTLLAETMQNPNTIDLTADGQVLLVSNRGQNSTEGYLHVGDQRGSVLAIDTQDGRILDAIAGGMQCTALDVSADGTLLVFSDFRDSTLRVYRIPPTETLRAGSGGRWPVHAEDVRDLGAWPQPPCTEHLSRQGRCFSP